VAGTTYNRLSDAFVFGGGAAVAKALGPHETGGPTAFVAVPESVWMAALESTEGFVVIVPERIKVFDGSKLVTIPSGEQTLTPSAVTTLLKGLPYVSEGSTETLRRALELQLALALTKAHPVAGQLESDMSSESLQFWIANGLSKAVNPQVK
jgi:hypothetical protein